MNLEKIFPFLSWIGKLKKTKTLKKDIIAGMSVAFVLVPQSMAYASLAGLPIEVGLYTAFIPVIIAALFGSSSQMSTGPVTIISLMTATALAPLASQSPEGYIVYASLLAFFIGVFYLILGLLKMGILVEFLSHPVIIGFTNGVAIITLTSQLSKIFGISVDKGSHYLEYIGNIFGTALSSTHLLTLIFGVISIACMILLKIYFPKLPRVLITLILAITASYFIGFGEQGGAIVGVMPTGLPDLSIPFLSPEFGALHMDQIGDLILFGIIIGLIGFTESISVAKFVGTQTKQKVRANRELIGQGLANISSSLFGGYGVAGSFSKTAVNLRAGAKTGFSSVVTGIIVGITLIFLTPLLYHLPTATLAAVIIVAVSSLIKISPIIRFWKIEKHDGIVAMITFILTLVLAPNIENAIFIGVGLSLMLFIYRTMKPKVFEVARYKDGVLRDVELFGLKASKSVSVLRFDGNLYFANAGYFEDEVMKILSQKNKIKFLIIDLEWMTNMDSSGHDVLEKIIQRFEKIGINIYLTGIKVGIITKFSNVGFIKKFGKDHIFKDVDDALEYIEEHHGKEADTETINEYNPDKKKTPELDKKIRKTIHKTMQ